MEPLSPTRRGQFKVDFTDLGQYENAEGGCANCTEKDLYIQLLNNQLNDKPPTMGPKKTYLKVLGTNFLKNISSSFVALFDALSTMYSLYYNEERRAIEGRQLEHSLLLDEPTDVYDSYDDEYGAWGQPEEPCGADCEWCNSDWVERFFGSKQEGEEE